MENQDISRMVHALENNQSYIVNDYLKQKWGEGVNSFVEVVSHMRSHNSEAVDSYFNSSDLMSLIK